MSSRFDQATSALMCQYSKRCRLLRDSSLRKLGPHVVYPLESVYRGFKVIPHTLSEKYFLSVNFHGNSGAVFVEGHWSQDWSVDCGEAVFVEPLPGVHHDSATKFEDRHRLWVSEREMTVAHELIRQPFIENIDISSRIWGNLNGHPADEIKPTDVCFLMGVCDPDNTVNGNSRSTCIPFTRLNCICPTCCSSTTA